jgi:Lon protease-like protein
LIEIQAGDGGTQAMKPIRIPLFPLNVVLLPGSTLPLHIFEHRYRVMVRRCLSEGIEFGIILATDKGVATVGCTAAITQRLKEHSDGRCEILTEGRSVFRVVELLEEKEYREALVEYLAEDITPISKAELQQKEGELLGVFQECHALLYDQPWVTTSKEKHGDISYRMAARLPLNLEERQTILEFRAEPERQDFLIQWMTAIVPRLIEQRLRRNISSNGCRHGMN